jgi:hypothetical protein
MPNSLDLSAVELVNDTSQQLHSLLSSAGRYIYLSHPTYSYAGLPVHKGIPHEIKRSNDF